MKKGFVIYARIFILFLFVLLFQQGLLAQTVGVGAGSYSTQLQGEETGPTDENNVPVTPSVTAALNGVPIPTNDWWTSLVFHHNPAHPYSQPMHPHPFSMQAHPYGMALSYRPYPHLTKAERMGVSTVVAYGYTYPNNNEDVRVIVPGLNAGKAVLAGFGDWTVTAQWPTQNGHLEATFGHGLPYVYFEKTVPGDVVIEIGNGSYVWRNADGVLAFTRMQERTHYAVFAPPGSTWLIETYQQGREGQVHYPKRLRSSLNGNTVFSIALLPETLNEAMGIADIQPMPPTNVPTLIDTMRDYYEDANFETSEVMDIVTTYYRHAFAFVTDSTVSWNVNEAASQLTTTYSLETDLKINNGFFSAQPLTVLYRHQWLYSPTPLRDDYYYSPRGIMKVAAASSFQTVLPVPGLLPYLPKVLTSTEMTRLNTYLNEIENSQPDWFKAPDTYWNGKEMGRVAQLLPLAEQANRLPLFNTMLARLKLTLEDWLSADDGGTKRFYYDSDWGALIGFPSSYNSDKELNDHHFHYGYHIMAAAAVARYDKTWASAGQWGGMVNEVIKDVANWRNADGSLADPDYPFLRYFDAYAGHCWANGAALFGSGNNQESSSESINFSAGLILWGAETGQKALRDLGIYLYTTEISAIRQYWFDEDKAVFPKNVPFYNSATDTWGTENFDHPVLGIVWSNKGDYATWFSAEPESIQGINYLPITAASLHLGHKPQQVLEHYNWMINQNHGPENDWVNIIWEYLALGDAAISKLKFDANPSYQSEAGGSKAHTFHWIFSLDKLGRVSENVTADSPFYQVFETPGTRTYAAYNPSTQTRTATFSDGYSLVVFPGEVATGSVTISGGEDNGGSTSFDVSEFVVGPNPYNPQNGNATLQYVLSEPADVTIYIASLGREIVFKKEIAAGFPGALPLIPQTVTWDGRDTYGNVVPNGVYIAVVVAESSGRKTISRFKVAVLR